MKTRDKILNYIRSYIKENGFSPSIREITKAVGLKSISTTQFHLQYMEYMGLIARKNGSARSIVVLKNSQPETYLDVLAEKVSTAQQNSDAIDDLALFLYEWSKHLYSKEDWTRLFKARINN